MSSIKKERKAFLLYSDNLKSLKLLSNEQAGILFKTIYNYVESGTEPTEIDPQVEMAFLFIKDNLDRTKESYEAKIEKSRINGSKGGLKKAQNAKREREKESLPKYSDTTIDVENLANNKNININEKGNANANSNVSYIDNLKCEKCGGRLLKKQGKWGNFLGCSNYPACDVTKSVNEKQPLIPDQPKPNQIVDEDDEVTDELSF